MVQDKKKISPGKNTDASKNSDRKAEPRTPDRDTARQGSMKDKDVASKRERDMHSRK